MVRNKTKISPPQIEAEPPYPTYWCEQSFSRWMEVPQSEKPPLSPKSIIWFLPIIYLPTITSIPKEKFIHRILPIKL
jgi:hypothetical protein